MQAIIALIAVGCNSGIVFTALAIKIIAPFEQKR